MWRIAAIASTLFLVATTCEEQPCDDYVDYMCACHEDDPEFDCEELQLVLSDADPELQDQCAVDLDQQQDEDQQEGVECEVGTGG